MYHKALNAISASEDIESDSDSLLQEIMLSQVNRRGGEKKSVLHIGTRTSQLTMFIYLSPQVHQKVNFLTLKMEFQNNQMAKRLGR
jgi:hypothetical protein